ncbi:glycosyl hydrolase catalytic core-domain-containing protein [Protomyces lactucae-debilis]|uniref:Glycosyl hydrolase catalytic core-domain-containing protein n=1 Tax=Protomyces lactucae-debilis TaxID=2754530 RepID=A0A1Y2FS45_PROLT|nr:glycosyl hydrolase catalytic core-domain-containing protein [Protomyces lactucae-debilis]ORY86813.1 glycosyl hydrolase catalytic core-domain-containing protein [Protomyces lactucae-debilis]
MLTQLQACMKDISCFSLMFKPVSTASTGTGNPTFNTVNSVSSGVLAGETPAFNNVALTNVENTGDGSVGNGNTNTQENGQESEVPGPPLSTPVPDASQPVQPVSDPTPQPSVNPQGIYTSRNTIPPATVPAAQPDPQQTPSPQPATASNSTADPVVSRRGLALDPNMPAEAIAKFNDHISFYYSWTMVSQSQQYTTAEFWPQMKAGNATQIARSSQELGTLLGFNEPNQPGQNLVSAADAALVYNAFFEQYKGTIKTITTPAPSNAADGLQYLKDFKTACTHAKCQELQVTAHFYGEDINFLQKQINQMCHDLGPIWITELGFTKWSGPLDAATVQALQKEMIEWLDHPDQAKCVTKYAFLASTSDPNLGEVNSGLTASGDLTALGRYLTTGQWS